MLETDRSGIVTGLEDLLGPIQHFDVLVFVLQNITR